MPRQSQFSISKYFVKEYNYLLLLYYIPNSESSNSSVRYWTFVDLSQAIKGKNLQQTVNFKTNEQPTAHTCVLKE